MEDCVFGSKDDLSTVALFPEIRTFTTYCLASSRFQKVFESFDKQLPGLGRLFVLGAGQGVLIRERRLNARRSLLKSILFVYSRSTQPFLEAVSLWSRLAITEQAVAANLPPGFLTSPHVIVPDLEFFLKVSREPIPW